MKRMKRKTPSRTISKRASPRFTYHETGILLEEVRHQVELVAEGVQTNTQQIDSLGQEMRRGFADLSNKIGEITGHLGQSDLEIRQMKESRPLT